MSPTAVNVMMKREDNNDWLQAAEDSTNPSAPTPSECKINSLVQISARDEEQLYSAKLSSLHTTPAATSGAKPPTTTNPSATKGVDNDQGVTECSNKIIETNVALEELLSNVPFSELLHIASDLLHTRNTILGAHTVNASDVGDTTALPNGDIPAAAATETEHPSTLSTFVASLTTDREENQTNINSQEDTP